MMMRGLRVVVVGLAVLTASVASAQVAEDAVANTQQAVGLFAQACLPYAANPDSLRLWVQAHRLPELPDSLAEPFAHRWPGKVFGASTNVGKLVLVSADSGACSVIAVEGDGAVAEHDLLDALQQMNVAVTLVRAQSSPVNNATQKLYRADLETRNWLLSITTHAHSDSSNMAPEVELLATSNR